MQPKLRAVLIWAIVLASLLPLWALNRYLQRVIQPRQAPARFFLFIFANFLLIIVYTVLVVGLIIRLFPVGAR